MDETQNSLPQDLSPPPPVESRLTDHEKYLIASRKKSRRGREPHDDIAELNITPMLDMMTIILVFLLKSYSASSGINVNQNVAPPMSSTRLTPIEAIPVTITDVAIYVEDKIVVTMEKNGKVPLAQKEVDELGNPTYLIPPLADALREKAEKLKYISRYNKAQQFDGAIAIIAHRSITYRLLLEVLYSAGQAEFGNYRFLVLKKD